jgi:hypothetical protein
VFIGTPFALPPLNGADHGRKPFRAPGASLPPKCWRTIPWTGCSSRRSALTEAAVHAQIDEVRSRDASQTPALTATAEDLISNCQAAASMTHVGWSWPSRMSGSCLAAMAASPLRTCPRTIRIDRHVPEPICLSLPRAAASARTRSETSHLNGRPRAGMIVVALGGALRRRGIWHECR